MSEELPPALKLGAGGGGGGGAAALATPKPITFKASMSKLVRVVAALVNGNRKGSSAGRSVNSV
jgi:hypothetical protein